MALKLLLRFLYRLVLLGWRIVRPIIVGVRLIIEQDGAVMLVRHTIVVFSCDDFHLIGQKTIEIERADFFSRGPSAERCLSGKPAQDNRVCRKHPPPRRWPLVTSGAPG